MTILGNQDWGTTTLSTTLRLHASGASLMRLGDTGSEARTAGPKRYAMQAPYQLRSGGAGTRDVWVSFGSAGGTWSDPISARITYDPPPTADNETWKSDFVDQEISFNCSVTLGVIDSGDKDNGPVTLVGAADGSRGTTAFNSATGKITYNATQNGPFTDTFTYTIADSRGTRDSAKVTITVRVDTLGC